MRISMVIRLLAGLGLLGIGMILQALIPSPEMTMLEGAVFDTGHLALFAVLAFVVLWLGRNTFPGGWTWAPWMLAIVVSIALGLATEFAQYFTGRDAGLMDFVRDLLGAGAALLVAFAAGRGRRPAVRVLAVLLAGLLLAVGFAELARITRDYRARNTAFPLLADFEEAWEKRFVHGIDAELRRVAPPDSWERSGTVGELVLGDGPWPGIGLREPASDWTGYGTLEFAIWSADPGPLELTVRVHDFGHDETFHDRFNQAITVVPGANRFRIPLEAVREGPAGRELDLAAIAGVAVFSARVERSVTLWFDEFRLADPLNAGGTGP